MIVWRLGGKIIRIVMCCIVPAWDQGTPIPPFFSLVHSLPHLLVFFTFSVFPFSFASPIVHAIATDGVAWSVGVCVCVSCMFVCHVSEPCKTG